MLLIIDNYDSFTYNLVAYFQRLGEVVYVYRHDALTIAAIKKMSPDRIVISPGPGTPDEAGISLAVIEKFAGKIPLLGVCLGHQAIGQWFGAPVVSAQQIMHGKTSAIYHNGQGVFRRLPNPFTATRYHSLALDPHKIPDMLEVTAWTQSPTGDREEIMGIRHRHWPVEGVQFHPESILTEAGLALLKNFCEVSYENIC